METRQPRVAVELPVTPDAGKREITLRFRARSEVREHVAACVALMYLLPDDGLDEAGNVAAEIVRWTLAELTEAISPMDRSQLRAVIADAHAAAPVAVENAIIWAPALVDPRHPGDAERGPLCQWHGGEGASGPPCQACADEQAGREQEDDTAKSERRPWPLLPDACGFHGGEGKPGADRCRECARTAAERKADTEMTPVSYLPLSSERLRGARIGGAS